MEIKSILSESLNAITRATRIVPKTDLEISALRLEIYVAFQSTLDAMAMIISDAGLRRPSSYSELGTVLKEAGLLEEVSADFATKVALIRNTLAHAYRKIGEKELTGIIKDVLPELKKLIGDLVNITDKSRIDPPSKKIKITEKIEEVFKEEGVKIAYLFGSRAKGREVEASYYDIAVLLDSDEVSLLKEIKIAERLAKIFKVTLDKVEVVSLNSRDSLLLARVLNEGKLMYCKDDEERKRWERESYLYVLDNSDVKNTYVSRTLRRL